MFYLLHKLCKGSLGGLFVCCLLVHFFHASVPFDFMGFQTGMNYIIWFYVGYLFHAVRVQKNMEISKKAALFFVAVMTALIIVEYKYISQNVFFRIMIRSAFSYSLCLALLKWCPAVTTSKMFKCLLRNSFFIYLFHDPLEYIVLRFTFHFNWLANAFGVYFYLFARTAGVIIASILFGEAITFVKKKLANKVNLKAA